MSARTTTQRGTSPITQHIKDTTLVVAFLDGVVALNTGITRELVITLQQEAGRIAVADGEEMAPFVQTQFALLTANMEVLVSSPTNVAADNLMNTTARTIIALSDVHIFQTV
jgi:hypothetical protein